MNTSVTDKPNIKLYTFVVLSIFLAIPLRQFFPTTIILEVYSVFFICLTYYKYKRVTIPNIEILFILFLFFKIFLDFIIGSPPYSFFAETYRFIFFFIFFIVLKNTRLDYTLLIKIGYYCCQFHIFFTLYEFIMINIVNHGNFDDVVLIGKLIIREYPPDSQYRMDQWEFGFPFIRPFGLLLQPQKSGFILVFGIILTYIFSILGMVRRKRLWYLLFLITLMMTGAKTAILTGILIFLVIVFDIKFSRKMTNLKLILYTLCLTFVFFIFLLKDINANHIVFTDVSNDIISFFNYNIWNILFGAGIPDQTDLINHGFICESFLARILAQFGIIGTIILVLFSSKLLNVHNSKLNLILVILFLGLISHYCVINSYFITFILAITICFLQKRYRDDHYKTNFKSMGSILNKYTPYSI